MHRSDWPAERVILLTLKLVLCRQRRITLRPVYSIGFLNYNLEHADKTLWDRDHLVSEYIFTEKRTGEVAPPTISAIFVELARFAFNEKKKLLYERSIMKERDIIAQREYAVEESFNDGYDKGLKEGARETAINTAKSALMNGLAPELVATITGLDIDEVLSLKVD